MSNDISKLSENTTTYSELRAAANQLLEYVSFASYSEILETKVAVNEATAKSNGKTTAASVAEVLLGSTDPIPLYNAAISYLEQSKANDIIQTAAISPVTSGKLGDSASNKKVSIMQHAAQSSVDYASVLTDISALFCNLMPPVEMSLCVPYFDVRIIYPQEASGVGKLSVLNFVALSPGGLNSDSIISSGYRSTDTQAKIGFDVAGMEIFCLPQTLAAATADLNSPSAVGSRGIEILNPLVPLLTLESANIQQIGINGSLYAQTKIDLKMTLHDRSRLPDVEPLVSAEIFPTSTFRITYGWSHPDTNKMTGSAYAKLINAMKVTQDFSISSVSLSASDSTSISISVSLISQGSFTAKSAKIITANGEYLPYTVIRSLVSQFANIRKSSLASDKKSNTYTAVGTTIFASQDSASSSSRLVKIENFYNLVDNLQKIIGDSSESASQKIDQIIKELSKIDEGNSNTKDYSDIAVGELEKVFGFVLSGSNATYGDVDDPGFYKQNTMLITKPVKDWVDKVKATDNLTFISSDSKAYAPVVPLSAVVYRLIAKPLILTQPDIDEVRIHFFSFNSACGEMAEENIGNFPIIVNDMIHRADNDAGLTQRSSVEAAITKILNQVNTPGNRFFGLSALMNNVEAAKDAAANSEGSDAAAKQQAVNDAAKNAKQLVDAKNAGILERKEIKNVDTSFVPARVKHQIEILPAYESDSDKSKPAKKIARIIFFDERSGNFNKIANLLFSMISTNSAARIKKTSDSLSDDVLTFFEKQFDADNNFYTIKDKKSARALAENMYPTIRIGSDAAVITSATYTSQPSGDLQGVYLLSALGDDSSSSTSGASAGANLIDDVFIIPSAITLSMLGNTCITRGQTYYVDFGTGTTLDNAYTVTSVTHTLRPGAFTTTATLAPVFSASMKSITRQIQELQTIVKNNSAASK